MPVRDELVRKMESSAAHRLLVLQVLLTGIAFATGIVFWFFQGSAGFTNTFIYTFVIGNFTALALAASSSLLRASSPLRQWIIFLALLIPIGIIGGVLASLAIYALHPTQHTGSLRAFLLVNVRIGLFVTVITSIALFAAQTTRERLEAANRRLQDQVQLGTIRLQDQAAELTTAHEIQAHLIPANFPQIPGLQVSGAWQPAQAVGGDYFDVLSFDRRRLALCIADVSGKGMGAALLMANLQAAFRAFATEETPTGALCEKLNRALCSSIAPGKFVTFFHGIVDVPRLLFSYEMQGTTRLSCCAATPRLHLRAVVRCSACSQRLPMQSAAFSCYLEIASCSLPMG